jgi:hypothetical protein
MAGKSNTYVRFSQMLLKTHSELSYLNTDKKMPGFPKCTCRSKYIRKTGQFTRVWYVD